MRLWMTIYFVQEFYAVIELRFVHISSFYCNNLLLKVKVKEVYSC